MISASWCAGNPLGPPHHTPAGGCQTLPERRRGVLRHVYGPSLRVPLTGQPGRTAGLERPGFLGDARAATSQTMGRATASRTTGRATSRADTVGRPGAIVPLDLRAGGPPTLIHMDGHGGPVHREPAAGIMGRPLHDWGPDSADRSLHTA
jgi:hypothetical protein